MKSNEVILTYAGEDFWSRPVYRVNDSDCFVKDVELGNYPEPSLYWSYPKTDPEGEPDFPFKVKDGVRVFIREPAKTTPSRDDKKFILAKMIRAGEYNESRNSIEWVDLASGIHDIELTRQLLQELKENPMEIIWTSEYGYVRKDGPLSATEPVYTTREIKI